MAIIVYWYNLYIVGHSLNDRWKKWAKIISEHV